MTKEELIKNYSVPNLITDTERANHAAWIMSHVLPETIRKYPKDQQNIFDLDKSDLRMLLYIADVIKKHGKDGWIICDWTYQFLLDQGLIE